MTNKIVYHVKDLDGHCSGAITRYFYEEVQEEDVVMIPFDYGFAIPEFQDGDRIILVDVTFEPNDVMLELAKKHEMIIIDHHKTFIDYVNGSDLADYAEIHAEDGKSACELAYNVFLGNGERMPDFIRLLGRYDVWDQSDGEAWEHEILPFQYGCRTLNLDPQTQSGYNKFKQWLQQFFEYEYDETVMHLIVKGRTVLEYQSMEDARYLNHFGFDAEFDGLKAICINSTRFNSKVFDSAWDSSKYDLMICFASVKGRYYSVSLYSPKPDVHVGTIARQHGGGGHAGAAGFECQSVNLEDGKLKID